MRSVIVEDPRYVGGSPSRVAVLRRIARVIDFLFGVLYTLLLVRFALDFFGARTEAGFYRTIADLSDPFYAPFKGLFATSTIDHAHVVWPLVVAIVGYMVLHAIIRGVLHLLATL
jgi:YggT family protein